MPDVIYEMSRKGLGMAAVTDANGRLLGIITDGDLRRVMQKRKENVLGLKAADCMTKNPVTLPRSELAAAALRVMEEKKITSVLVVDATGASKAWSTSTTSGLCSSSKDRKRCVAGISWSCWERESAFLSRQVWQLRFPQAVQKPT